MPLESCMIVMDNSDYTQNGDYSPTRFGAQSQAIMSVFTAKTDGNPESSVGLLTMAGKSPTLLVTPTNDIGKLLSSMTRAQIGGSADLTTAVQIAQLALKHRENKNARQRVVVFAGSDIHEAEEDLVKLGKKLRKNNVLIDVCLFGEEGMACEEKVGKLIEAAGGGECHLVVIPPGPHLLSDVIQTSPILYDGAAQPNGDGVEGGEGMDGMAIDPNMDPELAMAIRMSLQDAADAAARQAAAAAPASASASSSSVPITADQPPHRIPDNWVAPTVAQPDVPLHPPTAGATLPPTITSSLRNQLVPEAGASGDADAAMAGEEEDEDEEEQLRRAMALSQGGDVEMAPAGGEEEEEDEDEDAAMARAIAMSMEDQGDGKEGEKK